VNEDALAERRRRRLWLFGSTLVVAAVLVGIAILVGQTSNDTSGTTTGRPEGIAEVNALFAGIPQRGIEVGSPSAAWTMTEFADIQCPFCGRFAREVLPEVMRRYVRTGKVSLVFRGLAFLGPDSERGARMVAAAGLQGKLWPFLDLLYRNQGSENSGWVTDAYLSRIGKAVGIDVQKAFAARGTPIVDRQLADAKTFAGVAGVKATPSFVLARTGRSGLKRLDIPSLTVEEFTKKLDEVLAGG
jgi:protein-disulfide isomerase